MIAIRVKRENFGHRSTQRREMLCRGPGPERRQPWEGEAEPRAVVSHAEEGLRLPEVGRGRRGPPSDASEGACPANTLTLDFRPPELAENKFLF